MSLSQLETRDFFAIAVLIILAIIIIAIQVFQHIQEDCFQRDLNTLELNDFVNKYKHEISEIELTLLWNRQQSEQDEA